MVLYSLPGPNRTFFSRVDFPSYETLSMFLEHEAEGLTVYCDRDDFSNGSVL